MPGKERAGRWGDGHRSRRRLRLLPIAAALAALATLLLSSGAMADGWVHGPQGLIYG